MSDKTDGGRQLEGGGVGNEQAEAGYLRHITLCRVADLSARVPFHLGDERVGWLERRLLPVARALGIGVAADVAWLDRTERLPEIAQAMAEKSLFLWRGEAFDVRAAPDGPVLATIDRGALPQFGIIGQGVHVNGLVERAEGLHVWVARRGADRPLDPGKLDHMVAGGISAGMDAAGTIIKESAEEAGVPESLAAGARRVGIIDYQMDRPEGLRRDRLHCFDLLLPEDFTPRPADGEAAGFELWPIEAVAETVAAGDSFKFNVNLVLIDLLLRRGAVGSPGLRAALDAFRHGPGRATRPSPPGVMAAIGPGTE